jgi:hypothetical protein
MTDARVTAVLLAADPEARWRIGVVGKRTYSVMDGCLVEAPQQVALVEAPTLAEDGLQLGHDTDLILRKSMVDVVVLGHVYPHESHHRCTASVRVGALHRTMVATGDRRLERDAHGRVRFTPPAAFERISLTWDRAYGGHDAAALAAHGDPTETLRREAGLDPGPNFGLYAYPRNPAGRGYLVELSDAAIETCRLPNLEDPSYLLTPERLVYGNSLAWPGGPVPVSMSWLPYSFFPRMTLLGFLPPLFDNVAFPAREFPEVRAGVLEERSLAENVPAALLYDPSATQGSAPGMRVAQVRVGDMVELVGLHPRIARWRFSLAVRPPRMLIQLQGDPPQELHASIRTVLLEPDHDRVCLVWVGELPIMKPLTPEQMMLVPHAVLWS